MAPASIVACLQTVSSTELMLGKASTCCEQCFLNLCMTSSGLLPYIQIACSAVTCLSRRASGPVKGIDSAFLCFLVHDCDPVVDARAGGCCANGYTCSRGSQYYWQCIQGTASPSPPPPPVTTTASSPPPPPAATTAPGDTAVRTVSTACCTF